MSSRQGLRQLHPGEVAVRPLQALVALDTLCAEPPAAPDRAEVDAAVGTAVALIKEELHRLAPGEEAAAPVRRLLDGIEHRAWRRP